MVIWSNAIVTDSCSGSGNWLGTLQESNYGVDLDAAGNVDVAGSFFNTTRFIDPTGEYLFGGSTSQNGYVAKVSPTGELQAFYLMVSTGPMQALPVAVDRVSGHIHTTGIAFGVVDFDPGPGTFQIPTSGSGSTGDFYLCSSSQWCRRMTLSGTSLTENQGQQLVGTLAVTNGLPGETFTFSVGPVGASGFALNGNQVLANTNFFDFESSSQATVQVQATGSLGTQLSQVFFIQVLNVNEAPLLAEVLSLQATSGVRGDGTGAFSDPDQGDSGLPRWTMALERARSH